MIGDSVVNDVYGARTAGLRSVVLDRDGSPAEGLCESALSFSSLNELASILAPESVHGGLHHGVAIVPSASGDQH